MQRCNALTLSKFSHGVVLSIPVERTELDQRIIQPCMHMNGIFCLLSGNLILLGLSIQSLIESVGKTGGIPSFIHNICPSPFHAF